jgi:hypothetical protein
MLVLEELSTEPTFPVPSDMRRPSRIESLYRGGEFLIGFRWSGGHTKKTIQTAATS